MCALVGRRCISPGFFRDPFKTNSCLLQTDLDLELVFILIAQVRILTPWE